MVRFIDLEKESQEDTLVDPNKEEHGSSWEDDRPNPNFSLRLSVVLSCYPIVSQLAQYVDINALHEMSRTCRQFRANLLQHRRLLIEATLRCTNENSDPARRLGRALNASFEQWTAYGRNGVRIGRISSGKVSTCARDMVDECRRCGTIVCRNCVIKAPSIREIKGRHRRLCRTCMKSPMNRLAPFTASEKTTNAFQYPTYARGFCTCEQDRVWICQPCGLSLRTTDTTYTRGWAWRTRYSACGGVGAGLGEGNEGVECGRYDACLDAKEVEREIECDADELAAEMEKAEVGGRQWAGSSYTTCEIVGIGGKVKKKAKKIMLVGAVVKEYDDEKATGKFLRREQDGANRSWCSWCARIVPGKKDMEHAGNSSVSIATTSSSESSI